MVASGKTSALIQYLDGASDQDVVTALVRRVRAWRRIKDADANAGVRRQNIEDTLEAILRKDPNARCPLALRADQEEPGPLPRILVDLIELIDAPLAAKLLDQLSSMDDRHRPLMFACSQRLIDAGAEDADTIILHLYAMRDAGDVDEAARLAKAALDMATDPDDMGRLDALLAEIAYDEQRYEDALGYWRASIEKDEATALRLNNCGATLQLLGRPGEAALSFLQAARAARRDSADDPDRYRSRGSACVNMAMAALERGRTGAALSLARIGTERYRDLLARHPGHSDSDAAELFSPLIVALDEADLTQQSQALAEEVLDLSRNIYRDNPDIGARALIDAITVLHGNALEAGRYDLAKDYSNELQQIARRHHRKSFGLNDEDLALTLASVADALFLSNNTPAALDVYAEVDKIIPAVPSQSKQSDVYSTHLNFAMALNDDGQRNAAAARLDVLVKELENRAKDNSWLLVLVARAYSNLSIVESERGRRTEAKSAILASDAALVRIKAGGRNQSVNTIEQRIAVANSLSHLGEYEDAISALTQLATELEERLSTQQDDAASHHLFEVLENLGLICHAAAKYDDANDAFQRAIASGNTAQSNTIMSQKIARMLINRAGALAEGRRFDEALRVLDQVEAMIDSTAQEWTDYLNNRAVVFLGLGMAQDALIHFEQARDVAVDTEDIWRASLNVAATHVELEQWQEARDVAQDLIDATVPAVSDPQGVDAVTLYFWISAKIMASRAAAFVSEPDRAVSETTETLSIFRQIAPNLGADRQQLLGYALEGVGDAWAAAGDRTRAASYWQEAAEQFKNLNPHHWKKELNRLAQKPAAPNQD